MIFFAGRFIHLEDLMRFMREDEAMKTIALIGGSHDSEKISKSLLKNWVVRTGKHGFRNKDNYHYCQ